MIQPYPRSPGCLSRPTWGWRWRSEAAGGGRRRPRRGWRARRACSTSCLRPPRSPGTWPTGTPPATGRSPPRTWCSSGWRWAGRGWCHHLRGWRWGEMFGETIQTITSGRGTVHRWVLLMGEWLGMELYYCHDLYSVYVREGVIMYHYLKTEWSKVLCDLQLDWSVWWR